MDKADMKDRIRLSEKIGYGLGDMSSSMFWKIFSYYLPFFYSNVFGLTLKDAATMLLVTKLYDAVSDPFMGVIADRTRSKWGTYRPYLLWCAVPFAVAGVLTFTTPQGAYTFKHIYAYVTYILMMTAYTAVNVPYGAMLGVLTPDSRAKTVFSSYRMFFAYAGSFIALACFEPLLSLFGRDGASQAHSWRMAMVVIGGLCAVLFFLCFRLTKERVRYEAADEKGSVAEDLKHLLANGPWWLLLVTAIGSLLFNSIRGGAAAYYFKDYLGDTALWSCGAFLAAGEIANMCGVSLAVPVSSGMGKKRAFIAAMAVSFISSISIEFLPLSASGFRCFVVIQILIGIAAGLTFPLLWSMFADVADWSEHKYGRASTGLIFSSSSMAQKFGGAFGSALILWLLAAYGYDTAEGAVQTSTAREGLRAMVSYIPAAGALISIIALVFYPLDEKKMAEIAGSKKQKN